jgi:hypothetical protein
VAFGVGCGALAKSELQVQHVADIDHIIYFHLLALQKRAKRRANHAVSQLLQDEKVAWARLARLDLTLTRVQGTGLIFKAVMLNIKEFSTWKTRDHLFLHHLLGVGYLTLGNR